MAGEHVIYTQVLHSTGTNFMLKLQRVAGPVLVEQLKVGRILYYPGRETTEIDAWLEPAGHNNCLLSLLIV